MTVTVSAQTRADDTRQHLTVRPSGGPLGAEISGIDLSGPMSDDQFALINDAWLKHLVIVFRGQTLTDPQLIAFGKRFGEIRNPQMRDYDPTGLLPEIDVISNVMVNGKPIGTLGAGEATWHTDISMFPIPASATILYGLEIPKSGGGNTLFSNMYAAHDTLPDDLKEKVNGRTSIHDISYTASGTVRMGFQEVLDKTKAPGAVHPIVRTHAKTGRKALYLGRRGYGYIHGLPVPDSDDALERVWEHMVRPEFIWQHEWKPGDLVVWDNRCVIHARAAFNASERRILHRLTIVGEKPV